MTPYNRKGFIRDGGSSDNGGGYFVPATVCKHEGKNYRCIETHPNNGTFNTMKWEEFETSVIIQDFDNISQNFHPYFIAHNAINMASDIDFVTASPIGTSSGTVYNGALLSTDNFKIGAVCKMTWIESGFPATITAFVANITADEFGSVVELHRLDGSGTVYNETYTDIVIGGSYADIADMAAWPDNDVNNYARWDVYDDVDCSSPRALNLYANGHCYIKTHAKMTGKPAGYMLTLTDMPNVTLDGLSVSSDYHTTDLDNDMFWVDGCKNFTMINPRLIGGDKQTGFINGTTAIIKNGTLVGGNNATAVYDTSCVTYEETVLVDSQFANLYSSDGRIYINNCTIDGGTNSIRTAGLASIIVSDSIIRNSVNSLHDALGTGNVTLRNCDIDKISQNVTAIDCIDADPEYANEAFVVDGELFGIVEDLEFTATATSTLTPYFNFSGEAYYQVNNDALVAMTSGVSASIPVVLNDTIRYYFSDKLGVTFCSLSSDNIAGDVDQFAALVNLTTLNLDSTSVTGSIEPLAALVNLTHLYLGNTSVTGSIEPLAALVNLTVLSLDITSVTGSIEPLAALVNLTQLRLYNTSVTGSIEPLTALVNLTVLSLGNTAVTGSIEPLAALVNLTQLRLYGTSVTGDASQLSLANIDYLYGYSTAATYGTNQGLRTIQTGVIKIDFANCNWLTADVDRALVDCDLSGATGFELELSGTGMGIPTDGAANVNLRNLIDNKSCTVTVNL